jgi:hypothetical protein
MRWSGVGDPPERSWTVEVLEARAALVDRLENFIDELNFYQVVKYGGTYVGRDVFKTLAKGMRF